MTLIDKIEKAEAGSRELDAEILAFLDWRPADWEAGEPTVRASVEKHGLEWVATRMQEGLSIWRYLPRLTTSLDAAMNLIPEGWDWDLFWQPVEGFEPAHACLTPHEQPFPAEPAIDTYAATPALALVAACLKARSA